MGPSSAFLAELSCSSDLARRFLYCSGLSCGTLPSYLRPRDGGPDFPRHFEAGLRNSSAIGKFDRTKPKKAGRSRDHRLDHSAGYPPVLETALLRAFVRGALRTADENCPARYADGFHFLFFKFLSHFPKALDPTLWLREPEQRGCQENSRLQSSRSALQPAGHRVCQD